MKRGFTLVELLVVITILAIVTAAAIPIMAPAVETRRVREAARMLSAQISGAQTRAIAGNRQVGVRINRLENAPGMAMVIDIVEVAEPYAGGTTGSDIIITGPGTATFDTDPPDPALFQVGDQIKFNYQGGIYRIDSITMPDIKFSHPSLSGPPKTNANNRGLPYQIYRQPQPTTDVKVTLPDGAAVDIGQSGIGTGTFSATDTSPVIVMFSPNGSAVTVYHQGNPIPAGSEAIYFLVGERAAENNENLLNLETMWVSIGAYTGMALVSPNAEGATLMESRQFAKERSAASAR